MASKPLEQYRTSDEQTDIEVFDSDSTNIDLEAEKLALSKVDWHLLPMIFLLYMFSFIDR